MDGSGFKRETSKAPNKHCWPLRGRGGTRSPVSRWSSLAQGDIDTAATSIRNALDRPLRVPSKELPPDTKLQRAPLLEAQVEIEIAAGNLDRARSAAEELQLVADQFHSKALVAGATLARGRVRLAEGEAVDAEQLFSEAARLWNEVGGPYEAAIARIGLAEALRVGGSDRRADFERQAALTVIERIEAAPMTDPMAHVAGREGDAPPAADLSVFRREGDYWSLEFEGRTVRVRDLKGMHYLARLLAHPGQEFHALDLVAAESVGGARSDERMALGDAGELLDARAKSAYRRRLAEIEDDIEQARALGDAERESQADAERDFLIRELSRAVGLGGRDRRASSASERARVGVTRAIRYAMARIGEHHPCSASISTFLSAPARTAATFPTVAPSPRGGFDTGRQYSASVLGDAFGSWFLPFSLVGANVRAGRHWDEPTASAPPRRPQRLWRCPGGRSDWIGRDPLPLVDDAAEGGRRSDVGYGHAGVRPRRRSVDTAI